MCLVPGNLVNYVDKVFSHLLTEKGTRSTQGSQIRPSSFDTQMFHIIPEPSQALVEKWVLEREQTRSGQFLPFLWLTIDIQLHFLDCRSFFDRYSTCQHVCWSIKMLLIPIPTCMLGVHFPPHLQTSSGSSRVYDSTQFWYYPPSIRFHKLRAQSYKTDPLQMPVTSPDCHPCFQQTSDRLEVPMITPPS